MLNTNLVTPVSDFIIISYSLAINNFLQLFYFVLILMKDPNNSVGQLIYAINDYAQQSAADNSHDVS